jgi:hypothetical protein
MLVIAIRGSKIMGNKKLSCLKYLKRTMIKGMHSPKRD